MTPENDDIPGDAQADASAGGLDPPSGAEYDETQIRALEGIEDIRTRPAMYIGDTTPRGLHHLVYEVVDNSIDEAVNGFARLITVRINADGSVTITDDGRGIPVGPMPDMDNRPAVEVVLTEMHAGGKFDRARRATKRAPADCTASESRPSMPCRNGWKSRVRREGHVWTMEFARGEVTSPLQAARQARERPGRKSLSSPTRKIFPDRNSATTSCISGCRSWPSSTQGMRILISDERTGQIGRIPVPGRHRRVRQAG